MNNEVQDPDEEIQTADDQQKPNPTDNKPKKDKGKDKDKKKRKRKKDKPTLPAYFTEKDLTAPNLQKQDAMRWLLGQDNEEGISHWAQITYIGRRNHLAPKGSILIGKRKANSKNNNWKLFHTSKPFFRNQESEIKIMDPDFIRLICQTPAAFKVKFRSENPLNQEEARKIFIGTKAHQHKLSYRIKLARLRSGQETLLTLDEAKKAKKDLVRLGPSASRPDVDLKPVMAKIQKIIDKAQAEEKKKPPK